MPFAGLIGVCRLTRISACSQIQLVHKWALVNVPRNSLKRFSTGSVNYTDKEREDSLLSTKLPVKQALSRRRPLSPLERISSLLPQDALTPEVMQLRQGNQHEPDIDTSVQVSGTDCIQEDDVGVQTSDGAATSATLPGESLLAFGELLVAEYRKKGRVEFRKMFQLQAGTRLQSSWGIILHDNIARQPAGRILKTSRGFPILVRRASLEDYVLFMRRGPAIAYPKVCLYVTAPDAFNRIRVSVLLTDDVLCCHCLPGCRDHADDDGCHRGRHCAGVRLWVRGHVSVPVSRRSAHITLTFSDFSDVELIIKAMLSTAQSALCFVVPSGLYR